MQNQSVVSSVLKKFPIEWRQQDCLNKVKAKKSSNARAFSFEDVRFKPGCRKFVAAEIRDFYLWYRECAPELRHFYEIILEGYPCRLYFDLEFPREGNEEVDGPALVLQFCEIVCRLLKSLLCIPTLDPLRNFLILDSSNVSKFSAHAILHVKLEGREERVFPDNVSLKTLVMFICSHLIKSNCCLVKGPKESNPTTFLCDVSVYTKNRNFRLYQSSKCGKVSTFKLADYCTFYEANGLPSPKNAQVFLDSLVIPFNYHKLEQINLNSLPKVTALTSLLETLRQRHFGHGGASSLEGFLVRQNEENEGDQAGENIDEQQRAGRSQNQENPSPRVLLRVNRPSEFSKKPYAKVEELAGAHSSSPFPFLDDFMLGIFQRFNPIAGIRLWRIICTFVEVAEENGTSERRQQGENGPFYERHYSMQYQIARSRYCMNRGREHHNQNVYWVVDFSAFYFVQRCFDKIDCPNYISPAFAFPREICVKLHENIGAVFERLNISSSDYTSPDLDALFAKRYQAISDSFNKSIEWGEKYGGALSFLELHSTPGALKEREIAEASVIQEEEEEEIDVVN